MTTPSLNTRVAKSNAIAARTVGHVPPGSPSRREGLLRFVRDSSVYFKHVRRSYTDTEWGMILRQSLEGTKYRDVIDKIFSVENTP